MRLDLLIQSIVCIAISIESGAVLAQKFSGHCPLSSFITESISPFSETEKIRTLLGLHLKSIISRVANSVMC